MKQNSLFWLVLNAGSVIKYRTTTELQKETNPEKIKVLREALLSDNMVQTWLNRLDPKLIPWGFHGANSGLYENVMGKLYEFGLRKGIKVLDEKTKPYINWLRQHVEHPTSNWGYLALVAAFLSMTGYSEDEAVKECTLERLETVYSFAKRANFSEIYVPQKSFHGIPKAFKDKPLLNPSLETENGSMLPSIYDINAFLHSTYLMEDAQLRSKVEKIVEFILIPEYQKLYPGYGVVVLSGKFYSAGWSVHLPGYFESDANIIHPYQFSPQPDNPTHPALLLRLSMMSRSETARKHSWFNRMVLLLETYRTKEGLFVFPRPLVPEKDVGYWIAGRRLGLEADRRTKKAIMCESTFRYHEITMRKN